MLLRRGAAGDLKRFANLETLAWEQNAAVKDSLYKFTPLGLLDEDSILRDEHVKLSTPARAAKSEEESSEIVTGVDVKVKGYHLWILNKEVEKKSDMMAEQMNTG